MWYLLQFIAVFVIFFIISYVAWYVTENNKVPEFLQYKPWICRLCLTLWLGVALYIIFGISFKLWVMLVAGLILSSMNALAMWLHQKNNTIKIEDYGKLE